MACVSGRPEAEKHLAAARGFRHAGASRPAVVTGQGSSGLSGAATRWMVQIAGHVTMAAWGFVPLHADAKRWVRSMKDDLRSRLMLFGEHFLWYTLQLP
jgi:hypothetical protein